VSEPDQDDQTFAFVLRHQRSAQENADVARVDDVVNEIITQRCPWVHRVWVGNYANGARDALTGKESDPPRPHAIGDANNEKLVRAYAHGAERRADDEIS
jgi:hypothetical protein